ncbi:MAG: hypothetical protein R3B09_35215 [Nannocystaceae bacterium]
MSQRTGKVYSVAGRPVFDSRALQVLAAAHEVVAMPGGWAMPMGRGSIRFSRVEARGELPGQEGGLYSVEVEGTVEPTALRSRLLGKGLAHGGTFETWPGAEAKACGSCGASCGCGPCRARHVDVTSEEESP